MTPCVLSSAFALPWRRVPTNLAADRSRRRLSWASTPYSTRGFGDPLTRASHRPLTVRPQGLITLSAVSALRTPAGLVSCRRRSWDSPSGAFPSREVSRRFRREEPTYRFADRFVRPDGRPARKAAVPGLCPSRESLASIVRVSHADAGCSPGLFPLQGSPATALKRDFARPPLVRFFSAGTNVRSASAPEFRSAIAWPRPQAVEATLMGFCAGAIPLVRACQPLWLSSSPHATSCIAADRPAFFERPYGSTGAVRDAP